MKFRATICLPLCLFVFGCAEETSPASNTVIDDGQAEQVESVEAANLPADTNSSSAVETVDDGLEIAPLSLSPTGSPATAATSKGASVDTEKQVQDVINALKPLQVMLGKWRGTTRKDFDGFKAVDSHEWVWDLQSDPKQPALAIDSDKSPYLRKARLTWDADRELFCLEATDSKGVVRQLEGNYTEPVHEIVGPDDKLHRVFRLQLTQTEESQQKNPGENWQFAFAQQENNRYLLEVDRRRGKAAFRRYDTVSTQRDGTSFAMSDSDYGDKTCIISQGLGTISVSYKGKSYWVCCTGCKAAFEAEPETWIARAARQAEMK